ncbi:hypothetical protein APT_00692 [Acetobacter pasteurianus NBRC 101655]|nr:hypothetical protein APT_00692 [Acetobacter pasteurianus NBRC 101655]CCT60293.1 hypothetical protein APA386B_2249 [Acetobacter pasteurianus 386B]
MTCWMFNLLSNVANGQRGMGLVHLPPYGCA